MTVPSPTSPQLFEDASPTAFPLHAAPAAESLEQLQTDTQVELLNVIDDLRMAGLEHHGIDLPQLIVCGQQSSGKSSLLESLTDLRFPTDHRVCTLFPTEVIMRDAVNVEICCTILPTSSRPKAEREKLENFKMTFVSRQDFDLISVVEHAKREMSLSESEKTEDVLRIKYCGPKVPSLTIVDLPGIIDSAGDGADVIQRLLSKYMQLDKSIILAVITADNDPENQGIIKLSKKVDPKGSRTLGIITKTDRAEAGGEQERVMKFVKNEIYPLKYGWHAVKNRGSSTRDFSNEERDESEHDLFSTGWGAMLPHDKVGIPMLRKKLCRVLLEHVTRELPPLVKAVRNSCTATAEKLKSMGDARETSKQQRIYLISQAQEFQTLTQDALRGSYEHKFFTSKRENNLARLRTRVQTLNLDFANMMYHQGHRWSIDDSSHEVSTSSEAVCPNFGDSQQGHRTGPYPISRAQMLHMTGICVRQNLPRGLIETVNPTVIREMFRDQSQPWSEIASGHIQDVFGAVRDYIIAALNSMMDSRTCRMLMHKHIDPQLKLRKISMEAKVAELLMPFTEAEPVIYDPSFQVELNQRRAHRYNSETESVAAVTAFTSLEKLRNSSVGNSAHSDPQLLTAGDSTNADILDYVEVYYKRAIQVFICNITSLAIESCLLKGVHEIFCSREVVEMSDEKLHSIAAESEDSRTKREELRKKLSVFHECKDILDGHIASQPIPCEVERVDETVFTFHERTASQQIVASGDAQKNSGLFSGYQNTFVVTPPDSAAATPLRSRSRCDSASLSRESGTSPSPSKMRRQRSPLPRRMFSDAPAPVVQDASDSDL